MLLGFPVKKIFREIDGKHIVAQAIWQPLPLGTSYWFLPKGPLGDADSQAMLAVLKEELSDGAFMKLEPTHVPADARYADERHPAHTVIVPLQADAEMMLAAMKPKTRYNIRLAQKKGVQVEYADASQLERFLRLMRVTAKRDGFHLHTADRYRAIVEKFSGNNCRAFLVFATYEGKDLAANMMIDAFGTRTYLHGASSNEDRDVMAPYALHFALMRDAAQRGLHAYDFWGVAPEDADASHAWLGITRFKLGFGGERISMPGTFDVPISKMKYGIYTLARKVRR